MNNIVLDSDTLVKLAEHINKGWPNLYQATVEDKHFYLESMDGPGIHKYTHVNGRMLVRYIPERTKNETQYHFAAVELCGDITSVEGDIANVQPTSLRLTSSGNRGLIKTTDPEIGKSIVDYQMECFKSRKSHFIQPPASYCDLPHMYPMEWVSMHHPWMNNPDFIDFNIVGGVTLTWQEINAIPAIDNLGEFSKWVVELVRPIDSMFDDDTLYLEYHHKGLIDDSYHSMYKEW